MLPKAKTQDLVTRERGHELEIRDERTGRVLILTPTATLVFTHCDGETPVATLVELLRERIDPDATSQSVWQILDALADEGLLAERAAPPAGETVTRRGLFRYVAAAGAAAAVLASARIDALAEDGADGSGTKGGSDDKKSAAEQKRKQAGGNRSEQAAEQQRKREARQEKAAEQKKKRDIEKQKAAEQRRKLQQRKAAEHAQKKQEQKAAEQKKKLAQKQAVEQKKKRAAEQKQKHDAAR